jgi:hypothetical protein
MTDQEKTYFSLNEYFLSLQHKLTKYKMSENKPPEYLLKEFANVERLVRLISSAPEK